MMPTFYIKGGGGKAELVAHARHKESRGREASSSFVSTTKKRATPHVTHKTNEQTKKKKRTKKKG